MQYIDITSEKYLFLYVLLIPLWWSCEKEDIPTNGEEQGTTQPTALFGPNWRQKPGNATGLTEQLSGCMLIEAAALLDELELL